MDNSKIIEGNRKCAEFLVPELEKEITSGNITINENAFIKGALISKRYEDLKYHTDFNEQIKVYSKLLKELKVLYRQSILYKRYEVLKRAYNYAVENNDPQYGFTAILEALEFLEGETNNKK